MKRIPVGILGATGTVGQRFVSLLSNHPWFEITHVAASPRSAGQPYGQVMQKRWTLSRPLPEKIGALTVLDVEQDLQTIAREASFVFCALSLDKEHIRVIENRYAQAGLPVVSNNSAHRSSGDVPMIIPEINPHHLDMIPIQQKNRGWTRGFIVVKPNCSIQSYMPVLDALKRFGPKKVIVSTYQALSGAGKTLDQWPEMQDNINPLISGEEKKSEDEPLKIWATIGKDAFIPASLPVISATCVRVPVSDGHLISASVLFHQKPTLEEIKQAVTGYRSPIDELNLPLAPTPFITWFDEEDRPQTALDRDLAQGMAITTGRFREDPVLHWKFIALSHNTLRGAAGGAVLTAELLQAKGLLPEKIS